MKGGIMQLENYANQVEKNVNANYSVVDEIKKTRRIMFGTLAGILGMLFLIASIVNSMMLHIQLSSILEVLTK